MLVSVSLNPSVDRYIEAEGIELGKTNRVLSARSYPGGKGINVARTAVKLTETVVLGFLPALDAALFTGALEREGVTARFVLTEGRARVNLKALDTKSRVITEFNEQGEPIPEAKWQALRASLSEYDGENSLFIFSGSLPGGCGSDAYAKLIEPLKGRCALDCAGEAFKAGLASKPFIVKPNVAELGELLGRELPAPHDVLRGARECVEMGARYCCVSMGASGAILTDGEQAYRAYSAKLDVKSTVGAGDALLAGLCAAFSLGCRRLEDALRQGLACASAAVTSEGTSFTQALRPELVVIERM